MSIIKPFLGLKLWDNLRNDCRTQSCPSRFDIAEILKKLDQGLYQCEKVPSYYIYQQINSDFQSIGLVALTATDLLSNRTVKPHEEILLDKLETTKENLQTLSIQINPVLLVYEDNRDINEFIGEIVKTPAATTILTENNTTHRFWVINDAYQIKKINMLYQAITLVCVGDGHHRTQAISNLFIEESNTKMHYQYFLSILVPRSQVIVKSYNRILYDLNGYDEHQFIHLLKKYFLINAAKNTGPVITLYLAENWYQLTLKQEVVDTLMPIEELEPFVIENFILKPLLGDVKGAYNKNIGFISEEIDFNNYLLNNADKKIRSAIFGSSITMDDIFIIANANKKIPPNSTWILPKIPNGFINYQFTMHEETYDY